MSQTPVSCKLDSTETIRKSRKSLQQVLKDSLYVISSDRIETQLTSPVHGPDPNRHLHIGVVQSRVAHVVCRYIHEKTRKKTTEKLPDSLEFIK